MISPLSAFVSLTNSLICCLSFILFSFFFWTSFITFYLTPILLYGYDFTDLMYLFYREVELPSVVL